MPALTALADHQLQALLPDDAPNSIQKLAVEVADVTEALLWAQAGADVLQLEKFSPDAVAACHAALDSRDVKARPLLAAAGGICAGNAAYVAAGADVLVTSSPYGAPPRDVQVTFGRPA